MYWCLPPKGYIKLTVDRSVPNSNGSSGCGGVFRTESGNWIMGCQVKSPFLDILAVELHAMVVGMLAIMHLIK